MTLFCFFIRPHFTLRYSSLLSAPDLSSWILDRPFPFAITAENHATIIPFVGHIAFNGNYYSDGGEVQFYAQVYKLEVYGMDTLIP